MTTSSATRFCVHTKSSHSGRTTLWHEPSATHTVAAVVCLAAGRTLQDDYKYYDYPTMSETLALLKARSIKFVGICQLGCDEYQMQFLVSAFLFSINPKWITLRLLVRRKARAALARALSVDTCVCKKQGRACWQPLQLPTMMIWLRHWSVMPHHGWLSGGFDQASCFHGL